jgi:hypothetical protein
MLDAGESYRTVADVLGDSEATLRLHYDGRTGIEKRKAIVACWSCGQLLGLVASSHSGGPFGLSGPSCPSSQRPLNRSFCPARQFQPFPCRRFDCQFGLPKIRLHRVHQPVGTDAPPGGRALRSF